MTPILNVIFGKSAQWDNDWHEVEPFVTMQDAQVGQVGLVYDDENSRGYFGLVVVRGEAHEIEHAYSVIPSIVKVLNTLEDNVPHVEYNETSVKLHVFTTYV